MALFFHRRHVPVNIICPVKMEKVAPLVDYLEALNSAIHNSTDESPNHALFHQVDTHHFCRWTVLPAFEGKYGNYPAQLLFESNIDEPLHAYLNRLIKQDKDTLASIYQHCEGFEEGNIKNYLRKHSCATPTFYRGAHFHSQKQIQKDHELYQLLTRLIDEKQENGSLIDYFDPGLKEQLVRHIKEAGITWPFETLQRQPTSFWPLAIGLLALSPFIILPLLIFLGLWWVMLRKHEASDVAERHNDNMEARHKHIRHVTEEELQTTQSPMTSIVEIKPGLFRLITLKIVLWIINLLTNIFYNKGKLGSINTIHFARWLLIDNNKRMVFLSNYDGSWENYLGDFIDRAAMGLTAIWSNADGFPKAKNLLLGGAQNDIAFKAYARKSQLKTHCWFSAYPQLSLQNILNNSYLRQGLNKPMDEKKLSQWLARF